MIRFPLVLTLTVSAFAATACSDEPTQPDPPVDQTSIAPSFAVGSNTWKPKAPLPNGQTELSAGMVYDAAGNSIVYAIGGRIDGGSTFAIQAYSMSTNTWTAKSALVDVYSTNGVGKIGSRLYFSGGWDYGSGTPLAFGQTWAYDYANDRLIKKADMPKITADGVSGVISNKLYVLPGSCDPEQFPSPRYCETETIKTFFRYDPSTNKWATLAAAPHFHRYAAGGVINGKLYVVGGEKEFGLPTAALDVYDPAANAWKSLASLPVTVDRASGAVVGNKLLVVSWAYNNGNPFHRTDSYDPATNKWTAKASLPDPAPASPALARVALNGKSYVLSIGGTGSCCDSELPSQLYTP